MLTPLLDALGDAAVARGAAAGDTLVHQGDRSPFLFLIERGAIGLGAVSPDGREAVLSLLGPGDAFGELTLFAPGPEPLHARALERSEVLALPHEEVRAILGRCPEAAAALLPVVGAGLGRLTEALSDVLLHDVENRLLRRLRALARDHGRPVPGGHLIRPPITQEDLARMIGATRETVNRTIGSLAARGCVRVERRRYVVLGEAT